jgi:hypothetical protein
MKGIITKLNAWKSGKGFFVGIDGIDYLCNGNPKIAIGDTVDYDTGTPTKDGKPTIKKIYPNAIEAFVDEPKKETQVFRNHDSREEYWKAKEKRDLEREPIHIRLECLKAAVEAGSADVPSDKIVELARRFEKYAKEGV